jgi:hypothetical protein
VDSRSETLLRITKETTPSLPRRTHQQVSFQFLYIVAGTVTGLTKWRPYRERPFPSLSPLATAPSTGAVANDINTAVNKITPADNNTMSSDPDSDDGDGKGGKDITASEQAGKSLAGMFSTHSKEKAT